MNIVVCFRCVPCLTTDSDECDSLTHNCGGISACRNIPGGFVCDCPMGLEYNGSACVGKRLLCPSPGCGAVLLSSFLGQCSGKLTSLSWACSLNVLIVMSMLLVSYSRYQCFPLMHFFVFPLSMSFASRYWWVLPQPAQLRWVCNLYKRCWRVFLCLQRVLRWQWDELHR